MGPWLIPLAAGLVPLVTHGNADDADPAVAAIVDPTGMTICSGTVIEPNFLLTAAHCVASSSLPQGSTVVLGAVVGSPTFSAPVAGYQADPAFDPTSLDHDAAIIVVAQPFPVTPVALGTTAPGVGTDVTVVGWGETAEGAGDFGTKREGTASVVSVDALTFQVAPDPSQPCGGDSGGPAFVTTGGIESLVGITSHGDVACSEEATFTRVDAETAGFIMPTLAALGPGTVAAGARCLYAAQCTGGAGACVAASDNPQLTYCTEPCSASSDCPGQMTCVSAVCRYPVPTPGAFGGACSADSDCIQGVCYESTCSLPCEPGGTEKCPSGASCKQQGDGFDYFCVLPPPATSKKGGCALGSSPGSDGGAWFAGALLVVAGRRRRKLRR